MRRWFAENNTSFAMAAKAAIFLAMVLPITLVFPTEAHAQGPALTTISEVRYSDSGWGVETTATSSAGSRSAVSR